MQSTEARSKVADQLSAALAGTLALFLAGCVKSILTRPVSATDGAWRIETTAFTDGPNEWGTMAHRWEPEDGTRFLWAGVDLTNTSPQKRRFNWDRCDLDDGADAHLPALVVHENGVPGGGVDIVEPGQKLQRSLVFSFPEGKWPTRLKCGDAVMPLEIARR